MKMVREEDIFSEVWVCCCCCEGRRNAGWREIIEEDKQDDVGKTRMEEDNQEDVRKRRSVRLYDV